MLLRMITVIFLAYENTNSWRELFSVIIELVDGGCWEVYSQDEKNIKDLKHEYKNAKIFDINK